MKLLPKRLTAAQRTQVKLAKINQKTGKSAILEAGKTVRNVAGQLATTQIYKARKNAEIAKQNATYNKDRADNIEKALQVYKNLMDGDPSKEGSSGTDQSGSTTELPTTSKLGG